MKILILGISGMLGNAVFKFLASSPNLEIYGTLRTSNFVTNFAKGLRSNIITGVDAENIDTVTKVFSEVKPQVVINCIGVVSQLATSNDPLTAIPLNSLLPHRLAALCKIAGARLIHISTDCVFSGSKGNYTETDYADVYDLYGRSKLLGEVSYPHAITLRTSIIGHELSGNRSLIDWFLSQSEKVKGYTNAIYSGLPTVELARVIRDYILFNDKLRGLYHVASEPISKYELLKLVKDIYGKKIEIIPTSDPVVDKSLNAQYFKEHARYVAPKWPALIQKMYEFK